MANSILTRIENLEKKKRIKQLPDDLEHIKICEAIILPLYALKDAPLSFFKESNDLLLSWEKKLGKQEFEEYKHAILQKRQTNRNKRPSNEGIMQRMQELQDNLK